MNQKIKNFVFKVLPVISFLISFAIFALVFWKAKALYPAEYLGFPLGFYHPPIMCNCVIDAICDCSQPEALINNLQLDIAIWLVAAALIGLMIKVVLRVINRAK